jgi:hypothetical protein
MLNDFLKHKHLATSYDGFVKEGSTNDEKT